MILRDVRCILKSKISASIGLLLYIALFAIGYFRNDFSIVFWLVSIHFTVGLFAIALQKRPIIFGFCNLLAEMLFATVVGWIAVLPIFLGSALFGVNLDDGGGFVMVGWAGGLAVIVVPCCFFCWLLCWGRTKLYPYEPNL